MADALQSVTNSVFEELQRSVKTPTKALGKDEFLKLLTYQLKAQNPLKPQDGQQFAAQLAQFSSLEQLTNINKQLEAQVNNFKLLSQTVANGNAPSYIGKTVKAGADSLSFDGTKPAQFGYTLATNASTVKIEIKNSGGAVVRTIDVPTSEMRSGEHKLSWDGKDQNGVTVPSGQYAVSVTAKDGAGQLVDARSFAFGMITAVRFKQEGTMMVVGGIEIPMSEIEDISM
ncbi:MAG: flagellar hook capping protein [Ignavibacteria bacterium]|nr:flagellar hook capping protein [Ignavibacteria bacterium]